MQLRSETVYLIDERGNPYSMIDQWQDSFVTDVNGEPTDEIESVLVCSFRRGDNDAEMSREEYDAALPAYEAEQAEQEKVAAELFAKQSKAHKRATSGAVKKLKELGLTPKEAEAIVGLPLDELIALGVTTETE